MALRIEHRVSAHLPKSMRTWGGVATESAPLLTAGRPADVTVHVFLQREIAAGHSIELWRHFVSDIEMVQCADTATPAFFGCDSEVPAEPFVFPDARVHGPGTFFPYRRYAGVRLPQGAPADAQLAFHFHDVRMQTYEETMFNLRVAILNSDELVAYLGDAMLRIVGDEPASLRLIAPTCVVAGEPFDLRIVACDQFGNKSAGDLSSLEFELEHETGSALTFEDIQYSDDDCLHTVKSVVLDTDDVHYVGARLSCDGRVAGVSNPMVVRRSWEEKVVWGDLHQHAYFADGRGRPAANYEYARTTSCLDFCSVCPHQEFLYAPGLLRIADAPVQEGWEELVEAVDEFSRPGFVTILGSEAGSLASVAGHMNSYYLDHSNRPELERLSERGKCRPNTSRPESYEAYLTELESSKGEYLLLPHAHARGGPGQFDLPKRPAYQTSVEVCSVHGVFEECYRQWLMNGHCVGVNGGGDNHMTSTGNASPGNHYPNTNGLSGAFVSEHSRQGVWDSFRNRRTVAVTGNQRLFVEFSANGSPMGTVLSGAGGPCQLRVEVAGTAPILKIELVKNGDVIQTYRPELITRELLRVVWTDNCCSRRTDDSKTTGTISVSAARLSLMRTLNAYNSTDSFEEADGVIRFRSNAYSGIARGVLAVAEGADLESELVFEVEDISRERIVLRDRISVALAEDRQRVSRELDTEETFRRPVFTPRPNVPHLFLDVDWVDPAWPRTAVVEWTDTIKSGDWYYVRIEQIDANIAWTSPIWCAKIRSENVFPALPAINAPLLP